MYNVKIVTAGLKEVASGNNSLPQIVEWAAAKLANLPSYHSIYRALKKSPIYVGSFPLKQNEEKPSLFKELPCILIISEPTP